MRKRKMDNLTRIANEALVAGMSYGKYMAAGLGRMDPEEPEPEIVRISGRSPIVAKNILTGEQRYYRQIRDTEDDGFNPSSVSNVINGHQKNTRGWDFRRATMEEVEENEK